MMTFASFVGFVILFDSNTVNQHIDAVTHCCTKTQYLSYYCLVGQ